MKSLKIRKAMLAGGPGTSEVDHLAAVTLELCQDQAVGAGLGLHPAGEHVALAGPDHELAGVNGCVREEARKTSVWWARRRHS